MKKETRKSARRKPATKTSRKKTIGSLGQETEAILAAMGDAVSIQDTDFKILYQNTIHIGIIGDHKGEYCYRAYENRNHICDGCPVAMSFKDGKIHTEERSITKGNELSCFEITASPLRDSKGNIIAGIEICRDVTGRKQAEKLIIESEEKYKNLVELTTDVIYISDRAGNQIFMNDAGYRLLETTQEEVIGHQWSNWIHPDDREKSFKKFMEMIEKGIDVFDFENRYVSKSGKVINVLHNVRVLRNEIGEIVGTQGIARDIAERKRAEEELLKFKLGIERSDEAIFITNLDGTIIYVNPTFEKLYGYRREEALGKTPRILKSGLLPPEVYKQFWDTLLAKRVVKGELINKTRDGRLLNIEGTSNPIMNDMGEIIGFLAIQRDISERKQAEEEKDRLLKAIDSSTEGIAIADEKDHYIYVNAAYAMIFGYAQEELIGNTWRMITPTEMIAPTEKGLSCTMRNRDVGVFNGEVPGLRKDGTIIPTEVKGTGFWDERGNYQGHVCIVRDITERKRAEEELKIKALLLDRATDSIFVHDLNGNFIYINESAYKSRGYSKEEMMKMNLESLVAPEYGKLIEKHTRKLLEKGEHVFESADVCKNNSIIPLEVHACIIKSGGKKLILSVARDITERKQTDRLLKEKARAELYGFIVSALPVFASNVPSQVRNTLVRNFAERFEKNVRPRFEEEIKHLDESRKAGEVSNNCGIEMLDLFSLWLSGLFSNLGIQNKTTSEGSKAHLEFFNCPWKGEASINPIYCFMCRTIVIRSFTWIRLKGNVDQKSSIADGSKTCMFEINAKYTGDKMSWFMEN
ncbi:MAG TPA: PAS domain S-box protein [Candidatus Methanoperedens sp.]